ncbi:MAG: GNAT family N-acetyltransferase [Gemmatimonadales bacterium]
MAPPVFQRDRGTFQVSDDPTRIDLDAIHAYLTRCYWAEGISREMVSRSLAGSIGFGLYDGARQIGLARVITDQATFAYLCDVYVLEEYRGQQLGVWLMECVMAHPDLQGLRRFMLATRDAHALYAKFGFAAPTRPQALMEILKPGMYLAGAKP